MPKPNPAQLKSPLTQARWSLRDCLAASGLFLASAAVVLWQNAHLAILWDASYTLDTSLRIALGQMPYRDFPLVHSPLTFLIQAAIIRLTGRVFFHHVLYAALVSGLGTVLAWRIVLQRSKAACALPGLFLSSAHRAADRCWASTASCRFPPTIATAPSPFCSSFFFCSGCRKIPRIELAPCASSPPVRRFRCPSSSSRTLVCHFLPPHSF
jgi:hypothetical protein